MPRRPFQSFDGDRRRPAPLRGLLTIAVVATLALFAAIHSPDPAPPSQVTPEAQPAEPVAATPGVGDTRLHFGYTPDPAATRRFLATLAKPTLRQAGPGLFGGPNDGQPVLLYRALEEAHQARYGRPFKVGKQGIGDCVSWGWAHGADVHLAVMWKLGVASEWHDVATEPIYGGSRVEARGKTFGGWGDGSDGGSAAKWVREWGLLFRQDYPDAGVDLSTYSKQLAKQWGAYGCGGKSDAGKLDAVAKANPVRHVALVTTWDEAAAAIASGYPIPVCSGQGFANRRTEGGWSDARGSWSHCMCFLGVRFNPDGLLCLNSWGPDWISGPKWPEDQPDGSFWVKRQTVERMLRGEDSFAVSGFEGFPFRDLKHADWAKSSAPAVERRPLPEVPATEPNYVLAP